MDQWKKSFASKPQVYEAGFVQRREWMLYKIRDDHYPLNLSHSFVFTEFDPLCFQQLIDLLISRHEILRTTLQVIDGSLKQVVHHPDNFRVKFTLFDLRQRSCVDQDQFVLTKKAAMSNVPFNFEFGPFFRILVFATAENRFEITMVFHHVIFDQYSTEIFKRDALNIWKAIIAGNTATLPLSPAQYRFHTAFENELLETESGAAHRLYWQASLTHYEPHLGIIDENRWKNHHQALLEKVAEVKRKIASLPYYDERLLGSVVRRYQFNYGGSLLYQYSDETFQNLIQFRSRSNSSLHALFIAGLVVALHRLCGQQVYGFDIPAARKTDGDYKHLIGWLAAGGVCFFDVRKNVDTGAFLEYIDQQLYELAQHCVYPFEAVAYQSDIPAGGSVPLLFCLTDSNAVCQSYVPGGGVISHEYEGKTTYQDIDMFLTAYRNTCCATVGYNSLLIPPTVIEQVMAEQEKSMNALI